MATLLTALAYATVWFGNTGNKMTVGVFVALAVAMWWCLGSLRAGLYAAYLASLPVMTGKTHTIELVPPGLFPVDRWPNGYIMHLVIGPKHVIAGLSLAVLIARFGEFRRIKLSAADVLVLVFYGWGALASVFGSSQPTVSVAIHALALHEAVMYFLLRQSGESVRIAPALLGIILTLVAAQSGVVAAQFIGGSPVGKSVEAQVGFEAFGEAADEAGFRYRPTGTFTHANDLALNLTHMLPVVLSFVLSMGSEVARTLLLAGAMALVVSLGRIGWFGFATASLAVMFRMNVLGRMLTMPTPVRRITIAIIATVLVIVAGPRLASMPSAIDETGGLTVRIMQLEHATFLIGRSPLFGVGQGLSVPEGLLVDPKGILRSFPSPVHNVYMLLAAEQGLPASLSFIAIMLLCIRVSGLWSPPRSRVLGYSGTLLIGLGAGTLGTLLAGLFQPMAVVPFTLLALALAQQEKQHA